MNIRTAQATDIRDMVAIAETKRIEYEGYSPVFWRKATASAPPQEVFFPKLLALVAEEGETPRGRAGSRRGLRCVKDRTC